jgi:hypothetical protein
MRRRKEETEVTAAVVVPVEESSADQMAAFERRLAQIEADRPALEAQMADERAARARAFNTFGLPREYEVFSERVAQRMARERAARVEAAERDAARARAAWLADTPRREAALSMIRAKENEVELAREHVRRLVEELRELEARQ